uniref:Integrase catalytic domain-containing protein n=1 Tax=Tanacetum cinerariifolium TaxID=118510 RepID=A0A6L2K1G7_TANCI|nr:hypothetical protein [Tanacetum cinerariifolium]
MTTSVRNNSENYLEHPIPAAPVALPGQQVPPEALAAHAAWVKGQKKVDVLMLLTMDLEIQRNLAHLGAYDMLQELKAIFVQNYNMHDMGKTMNELHAMLKLHEETLPKKNANPALHAIRPVRVQKNQKNKPHKAAKGGHGKGKGKMSYASNNASFTPKPKTPPPPKKDNPTKDAICHQFLDHLKDHEIIAHRTPSYTPQNNKVSERKNRTLLDMVRSMMSQTTLPKSFWDYALKTAARILNMVPTKKVAKTPYEIWHGQAPKLSYLKVWGCEASVKRDTLTKLDKLDLRSFKCIFVGYPKETIGYSFYSPSENKVFVARNAEFFESKLLDLKASGSVEDLELIQEEDTNPSVDTSLNHEEDDQEIDEPQSDINPIRKSSRIRRAPDRMCLYINDKEHELGDLGEPAKYKAALLDPESKKWLDAMNVEMESMKDNDGFTQTYGADYEETFSPVADIRAIRILIAIATYYDYEIWKMDVKTAFINGHLFEEVYMEQPEGFVNPKYPNHVCKLKRSIYGLKQASRQWNK